MNLAGMVRDPSGRVRATGWGSNPYGRASLGGRPPLGGLNLYFPLPGERVQGEGSGPTSNADKDSRWIGSKSMTACPYFPAHG